MNLYASFTAGINWELFWFHILGEMEFELFLAYFALMCAGAFVYFTLDVNNSRNDSSVNPRKFSMKFLIKDNLLRGISVLLLIMASVIWYEDFFGVPINAKLAFISGLGIDAIIGSLIKTKKNSNGGREAKIKLIREMGLTPNL